MTRSTWKLRAGTVLASATAGILLTAGAAYADTIVYVLDDSGSALWVESGDTLKVCDLDPDGWGVRGYIYRPYDGDPENGTVLMKASDPKYDSDCVAVSTNISETIPISIKACNYKGDSVVLCGYKKIR